MDSPISFSFDVKSLSDAGSIEGLAAGYGNVDSHGDVFAAGAFAKSIANMQSGGRQPAMLLHHDPRRPIGKWDSIEETNQGLAVRGSLAMQASDGREAYALLKAGALTGLSVGFRTLQQQPKSNSGARQILEAELFEISIVSTPSNPLTRVSSVKSMPATIRELQELLHDAGYSSREAKEMASAAWNAKAKVRPEPSLSPEIAELFRKSRERLQRLVL